MVTASLEPDDRFGLTVDTSADRLHLAVRGDLDLINAPKLLGVLGALVEPGHARVVLDLADVTFLDAAGLGAIAGALAMVGAGPSAPGSTDDRRLVLRAPSPQVRRLLEIVELAPLLRLEEGRSAGGPLAGAQDRPATAVTRIRAGGRSRAPASLGSDDLVDAALGLVVRLTRATVPGAHGVSVSLQRAGHLSTVAATNTTITGMDGHQYATGEGPCVDAAREGRWFHADALATEGRWPDFVPLARRLGISAILSNPLVVEGRPVGALNIYSRRAGAFQAAEQALASGLAEDAAHVVEVAGAEGPTAALLRALHDRAVIAQAQGVLMARGMLSEEQAYAELRRRSVLSSIPLRDEAREVVASARPPPEIGPSDPLGTRP